jgi:hypothetical protein
MLTRLVRDSGRPLLVQLWGRSPQRARGLAPPAGGSTSAQRTRRAADRPPRWRRGIGVLLRPGSASRNPFHFHAALACRPSRTCRLDQRVALPAPAGPRARASWPSCSSSTAGQPTPPACCAAFGKMSAALYAFGDPPDYEPPPERMRRQRPGPAARRQTPAEVPPTTWLLADNGRTASCYFADLANYAHGHFSTPATDMLAAPAHRARPGRRRRACRLHQVGEAQQRVAALACAHELARAADLEVAARDLEAVGASRPSPCSRPCRSATAAVCTAARRRWPPRRGPTRPRSWCSCDRPKRSACSMTIRLALGTSTPTSITVVATSKGICPCVKSDITAAFSAAGMRPCSRPTSGPAGPRDSSAWVAVAFCRSRCSLSSTSGQTQ